MLTFDVETKKIRMETNQSKHDKLDDILQKISKQLFKSIERIEKTEITKKFLFSDC